MEVKNKKESVGSKESVSKSEQSQLKQQLQHQQQQQDQQKSQISQQNAKSMFLYSKIQTSDNKQSNEFFQPPPKPKCTRAKLQLNQEQTEALVLQWSNKGFGELNNWVQAAKAEQTYDFIENPIEFNVKLFTCKLEICFPCYSNIPRFQSLGTGKNKKDSKKVAQERIMLDIIKEGYINLGFKDDTFVLKIPSLAEVKKMIIQDIPDLEFKLQSASGVGEFSQLYKLDPIVREQLKSQQKEPTQSEINAFFQDISKQGLQNVQMVQGNINLSQNNIKSITASIPYNIISNKDSIINAITKEKEENIKKLSKLSKQMQDNLKQDKFFEACQILVQILSKKAPEWNEINHVWSYALLSKDIIYVKVLLDLIIQKTVKIKTAKEEKKTNNQGLKQEQDQNIEQAKKELLKKYGNNIHRLETDNVYDFFDTIPLMMNRAEIENQQTEKINEVEDQENIVPDLSQDHLKQEIEAQIINQQMPNQIIPPFDAQIKGEEKKKVLQDIQELKQQIEHYQGLQKLEQILDKNNSEQTDQTLLPSSQSEFIFSKLNDRLDNEHIPGSIPTKKRQLNDFTTKIQEKQQEEQQLQQQQQEQQNQKEEETIDYLPKINQLQSQLLSKENDLKKIDEEYQQFLSLQDQRLQQQNEQKQLKKDEQTFQEQNKLNNYQGNVEMQYYQQQQQPQFQQQQQLQQINYNRDNSYKIIPNTFQYPTMAYNHQDYSSQNTAFSKYQSYTNSYNSNQYHNQPQSVYTHQGQYNSIQQQQQQQHNQYYNSQKSQYITDQGQFHNNQQNQYNQQQGQYHSYGYSSSTSSFSSQQPYTHQQINQSQNQISFQQQQYQQSSSQFQQQQQQLQQQQQILQSNQGMNQNLQQTNSNNQNNSNQNLQQDVNLSYHNTSKQQNINYLRYNLIEEMYESLLYLGDMNFALTVAELIYSKVKINSSDFINEQAAHYYCNKKNMLIIELIEVIFSVFNASKPRLNESYASIDGTLCKIGNKFSQEVLLFKPADYEVNLNQKIAKKGLLEQKENYSLIAEGEFVILTSFYQEKPNEHITLYQDLRSSSFFRQNFFYPFNPTITLFINVSFYELTQDVQAFYNKISNNGQKIEYAMIGYIREISKEGSIKIFVLPTPQQSRAITELSRIWKITKLVNKTTYEKTNEALVKFVTTKCVSDTIIDIVLTPPNYYDKNRLQEMAETQVCLPTKHINFSPSLNVSQQNALRYATTRALTLIQGPPGTGKTTTAVQIVQEWCTQSPDAILACADSNIAADILHLEFIKAGIKACRIGAACEQKNEIMSDIKYQSFVDSYKKQHGNNSQGAKFMFIKKLLSDSQVVCATNVGSMSEYLKDYIFTRVIIDEATQSTEMSTIIPFINQAKQIVLIGDHKQLPPTVISSFAQSKGMTISLFERLVKQGIQPKMLMRQYRMHPSISIFPSHQFYNNMLENGISEIHRQPIEGFLWPNKLLQLAFIHIVGREKIYQSSVQNNSEVQVVIEILVDILKVKKLPLTQIGIITPYDAQKKRIKSEIQNLFKMCPSLYNQSYETGYKGNRPPASQIEVDTIDGYQGMEKDLIIISTVRSNTNGSIGFLKDPRRMNVALTRAKRGLIIVGNINTLQKETNWKEYITWVNANKGIIQYGMNKSSNSGNISQSNNSDNRI